MPLGIQYVVLVLLNPGPSAVCFQGRRAATQKTMLSFERYNFLPKTFTKFGLRLAPARH